MGWFSNGKCRSTNRLDGKTAIITGSNTGIGKITALDFVKRGAHVVMACRNTTKGEEALKWVQSSASNIPEAGDAVVMELNLASFNSIRAFADEFAKNNSRLHLLVNNAGVMMCPREVTEDGYELQMATNHLGHFLLTMLLLPVIANSTPARIINVASKAHILANSMSFDDFSLEKNYNPHFAYGRSKLANILFTRTLAKKLEGTGINVYALHPGVINTELTRHLDSAVIPGARRFYHWFNFFMKTPEQGAQTTIYCAVDSSTANQTGLYYDDCAVKRPTAAGRNDTLAEELWNKSVECVKLDNIDEILRQVKDATSQ